MVDPPNLSVCTGALQQLFFPFSRFLLTCSHLAVQSTNTSFASSRDFRNTTPQIWAIIHCTLGSTFSKNLYISGHWFSKCKKTDFGGRRGGEMLIRISRRCFSTSIASPQPWLFVGLGNPGEKYQGTRHNVGFDMIDALAESQEISMDKIHCKAIFGQGLIGDVPVLLAKPQTYMNLSGESAGPLAAYYKLPLNRVVVFFDDMDLPCGVLRLCDKGGHGGHKGLKSVIYHYRGNREFARLRIGIGRPPGQMDPKAFLLQKFNATARERMDVALGEGVGALKLLATKGLTESARCFNREQKYKHIRVQTLEM